MTFGVAKRKPAVGGYFRALLAVAVVCLLGFAGPSKAANLVTDGGFDSLSGGGTAPHLCANGNGVGSTCTSNLTSWSAFCASSGCVGTSSPSSVIIGTGLGTNVVVSSNNFNTFFNTNNGLNQDSSHRIVTSSGDSVSGGPTGGGNFVALDGDGLGPTPYRDAIYQKVDGLTIGRWYQVDFYAAGAQQGNTTATAVVDQMLVSFNTTVPTAANLIFNGYTTDTAANLQKACNGVATTLCQVTDISGTNPTLNSGGGGSVSWYMTGWVHETLYFKAGATTQYLAFSAVGSPGGGPPITLLDSVTLTDTPEPETLTLMAGGLLMLMGMGWRRTRRAVPAMARGQAKAA